MCTVAADNLSPVPQVSWSLSDGDSVQVGREFGTLRGSARSILVAERVALNLMQRMSGIATATHRMVQVGSPSLLTNKSIVASSRVAHPFPLQSQGACRISDCICPLQFPPPTPPRTCPHAQAAASSGSSTKVLETRKTVPGLRLVDKWAVLIGDAGSGGGRGKQLGSATAWVC